MKSSIKAALLLAALSGAALADVGGKEKGTYHDTDKETTTYVEINGVYLQQLHRSRFDKKDPNYYWLFDEYPCLYTEVWSEKYPCPVREREHYYEDEEHHKEHYGETKDVPEPEAMIMVGLGLVLLALRLRER